LTGKLFLAVVCMCLLAACGHSSPSSSTSASSSSIAPSSAGAASSASAVTVGCGTYCQQAGNSAGDKPPGYPCAAIGCRHCPEQHCVTLESGGATAANGVATVKLRCNLSAVCHGAFLICLPSSLCSSGPTDGAGAGGRLAGSDFVVPAGTAANVGVTLTDLGKQATSSEQDGFSATVLIDLLDYGTVLNTTNSQTGNFSLTSTDPPAYPAGATASCGGLVFVGPDTSCPFAKNVEKAYNATTSFGNATVTAVSPVTGQTYVMHCTGGSPMVCRGGTNALVEFYV
jgi:hypothetical protein